MKHLVATFRVPVWAVCLCLFSSALWAGEKKLMHCFYYTPIESATQSDWDAFYKATDQLPGKIPGLSRVWYGKLRRNFTAYNVDKEARQALAGGAKSASGQVTQAVRQHGVCMEMADEAALKVYADHPAHKEWEAVYSKVRQPGTTTFDILGQ
jgi:hypothetical protein